MFKSPLSSVTLDNVLSGETCEPIRCVSLRFHDGPGPPQPSLTDTRSSPHLLVASRISRLTWGIRSIPSRISCSSYGSRTTEEGFFDLPQEIQDLSPGPSEFSFSLPCPAKTAQRVQDSKRNFAWFFPPKSRGVEERGIPCPSPCPDASSTMSHPSSPMLPSQSPAQNFIPRPEIQPFRDECQVIVATFFKPGAQKELTMDSNVRDTIIRDLTWNTHPDVVRLPCCLHLQVLLHCP